MTAEEELVERMLPTAADLVVQIKDWDRDSIEDAFAPLGPMSLEARTVIILLGAMVPENSRLKDLLAWVSDPDACRLKKCIHCREDKPRFEFTKDCHKPDGRRGSCRSCDASMRRAAA